MDGQIAREIARRSEIIMLYENVSFMEALVDLLRQNSDLLKKFVKEISTDTP